ncbi:hypothetical protein AAY72_02145 [Alishewanella sp. WH16-1]|uniref:restriction endonuclease subunit S n=1 Tax=Alishewanella sp. WH16-1 TaxID=1651088 RepID=UPI00070CF1BA|nr:restriction endonuclease subunit S [Alishewanella sp. WH16-1]KRS22672.1 hypothetical protein AAY72_02145 [Alishewanella sp. WH16-1]
MNLNRIPIRRFPEFCESDSYKQYRFEDIITFSSGKNIKQNEASPEYTTPCVRYGELYHLYGEVITKIINRTNLDPAELKFSNGDEILLPSAGEDPLDIGSASALTLKNVAIGRTINVLRPNGTIDYSPIYVSFYINEKLKKKISTLARGASISNVYNSDLKCLRINLPNIEEQEKVANFLTVVDEKIRLLKEKHVLLQQYKKGVMQKLFSQEFRFKDDSGHAFPEWRLQAIGKYLLEHKERVSADTNLPILTSSREGLYRQERKVFNEGEYGVLPQGYFTYRHMSDDLIFKFNLNICWEKAAVSKEYPVFTTSKGLNAHFLEYCLNEGNEFKRFAIQQKVGGTRTRLYFKNLCQLKLKLPCEKEQQKISEFLQTLDKKLDAVQQQIDLTQTFRKGLLQQMFV